ncbi:MAG TPA: tetratricopeptide repeat protein [Chlamydiales bacterium]|nr:tetratricopeptide repeat protein [Chlamydiales bacterium]
MITTFNDEEVIGECLQSVKEIVDCVIICDRGSNDRTRIILENFFRDEGIPGAIYDMRSSLVNVDVATRIVKSLGWDVTQTFLLVLRPDAICEIGKDFSKAGLQRDAYLLLESSEDGSHYYYKPNFLRASIPWAVIKPYVSEHLKTFSWRVNSHEAYQSKRILNKIKELEATNPDLSGLSDLADLSYWLTLGGLYRRIKSYEKAISCYQKCAVLEERSDKVWYARYMLAQCLDIQGDAKNALQWYLEAYRLRPERMEPIEGLFMGQPSLPRESVLQLDIILN